MSEPTDQDVERAKSFLTVAQAIAGERERLAKEFEKLAALPLPSADKEGLRKGAGLIRTMGEKA